MENNKLTIKLLKNFVSKIPDSLDYNSIEFISNGKGLAFDVSVITISKDGNLVFKDEVKDAKKWREIVGKDN